MVSSSIFAQLRHCVLPKIQQCCIRFRGKAVGKWIGSSIGVLSTVSQEEGGIKGQRSGQQHVLMRCAAFPALVPPAFALFECSIFLLFPPSLSLPLYPSLSSPLSFSVFLLVSLPAAVVAVNSQARTLAMLSSSPSSSPSTSSLSPLLSLLLLFLLLPATCCCCCCCQSLPPCEQGERLGSCSSCLRFY